MHIHCEEHCRQSKFATNLQFNELKMMILEILATITGAALVAGLGLALISIVRIQLAYRTFMTKSRGVPLAENLKLLTGHLTSFFMRDVNNYLLALVAKHGDIFLIMYGTKPMVFTVDLDLIKRFALEEQQVNINRTELDIPMKELERDCIMLADGEQWRRQRRAIAPALR